MFDLRRIPITRVLLPFAGGSLAGSMSLSSGQLSVLWLFSILTGIFLLVLFRQQGKKNRAFPGLFFLLFFLLVFVTGFCTGLISRPRDPHFPLHEKVIARGVITEGPTRGTKSWIYGLSSHSLCSRDSLFGAETLLKVYLPAPVDTLPLVDSLWPLKGEVWQFFGQLVPVTNSGNPGATDFKSILNRKNCWYRFYPDPDYPPQRVDDFSIRTWRTMFQIIAGRIRKSLSHHWRGNEKEISLLKAICLGDRSDLTRELRGAYSRAGAMHLLAVSGLHMGLIWWVLYRLFAWMVRITGRELYRSLTIIIILWIFAFVTGFSSSVSRSATMFTLFTAGRLMDQRMHAMNGILVSAFCLILLDPARMFEVGFQLSYAAIMGIVAFYPSFRKLLSTKNRVAKWMWEGAMVSLCAQISTAPLVIYYFHQIPLYSLLSSLIAIPILSLLMAIFVISVPFMIFGIGIKLFNWLLLKLAFLINVSVEGLASIPGGVVSDLNLQLPGLWLWVGMTFLCMLVLNQRRNLARYLLGMFISATFCWSAHGWHRRTHTSDLVIGHFSKASILTFRQGRHVDHYGLWNDSSAFSYLKLYISQNWSRHRYQNNLIKLESRELIYGYASAGVSLSPGTWLLGNDQTKGWLISGMTAPDGFQAKACELEGLKEFKTDFLLLSGNPSRKQMCPYLMNNTRELILDGSNRNWYLSDMEYYSQLDVSELPLYMTRDRGAYLKRW